MGKYTDEELKVLLDELTELAKECLTKKGKPKKDADPEGLARIAELNEILAAEVLPDDPALQRPVEVGDVYRTTDKYINIITSEKDGVFRVANLKNNGAAEQVAWEKLEDIARHIIAATCQHHVANRNWTFSRNVAGLWEQ